MAKGRKQETKGPDWPPEKTLLVLRKRLDELQKLKGGNHLGARNDEDAWEQFTHNVMIHGFGEESQNVRNFTFAKWAGRHQLGGMSEEQVQENFRQKVEKFEITLESSIKELELMLPEYEASEKLAEAARMLVTGKENVVLPAKTGQLT